MHLYDPDTLVLPIPHKGQRQDHHRGQPWTTGFTGSDGEYLFRSNLARLAPGWYYRDHEVTYTFNTTGYRAPQFDTVDWPNSWVIMGCSYVLGVGVAFEDTLGEQLSGLFEQPVINLGVGGGNLDIMAYNTALMLDRDVKPRGVICLVPETTRKNFWMSHNWELLLPNQLHKQTGASRDFYRGWLKEQPMAELNANLMLRGLRAQWLAAGVPCYLFNKTSAGLTAIAQSLELGMKLPPDQDMARDVQISSAGMYAHPGRNTLRHWARFMHQEINQPYL